MPWSNTILLGKRVLISGASSGIGRACAILCSQLGASVIVCGRNHDRLKQTMNSLVGIGHLALPFELNDEGSIVDALSTLKGTDPISGYIHSAGIERTNPLKTVNLDDFSEMFKTNVGSAAIICRMISKPGMYDKQGLSIVLISSISGIMGEKGKIEYSGTKSALFGLTKALALELSGKGARVNNICPAMVSTEMQERIFQSLPEESVKAIRDKHLLGILEPDDVANMAAFLISDLAKHITATSITIDSGYSIS